MTAIKCTITTAEYIIHNSLSPKIQRWYTLCHLDTKLHCFDMTDISVAFECQ